MHWGPGFWVVVEHWVWSWHEYHQWNSSNFGLERNQVSAFVHMKKQVKSIDFHEGNVPFIKWTTIHLIPTLENQLDWSLNKLQVNVSTASSSDNEDIYWFERKLVKFVFGLWFIFSTFWTDIIFVQLKIKSNKKLFIKMDNRNYLKSSFFQKIELMVFLILLAWVIFKMKKVLVMWTP